MGPVLMYFLCIVYQPDMAYSPFCQLMFGTFLGGIPLALMFHFRSNNRSDMGNLMDSGIVFLLIPDSRILLNTNQMVY